MISFDEFKKVELTVGKILSAEKVPETDKLLKLSVDFGNNTNYETDTKVRTSTTLASEDLGTSFATQPPKAAPFAKGDGDTDTTTPAFGHPSSPTTPDAPPQAGGVEEGRETVPARDIRQIISGIALHFPEPEALVGRKFMFVTNIPPRVIKGLESNGMILAVSTEDGKFSLLEPNAEISEGTHAR